MRGRSGLPAVTDCRREVFPDDFASETAMLALELPFPPSVNHYWRCFRGRFVISQAGVAFRAKVAAILAARGIQPMAGPLAVRFEVYPPDFRRRDLDNLLKALGDSLEHGGAFFDDSQIVWLLIEKSQVVSGGKVLVTITERT